MKKLIRQLIQTSEDLLNLQFRYEQKMRGIQKNPAKLSSGLGWQHFPETGNVVEVIFMREASRKLINAIKKAAKKLRSNSAYSWGHLGSCNCGHLVQSLTKLNKDEIHEAAIESNGDWSEISRKYCDTSGQKIDKIISIMLDEGLNIEDIEYLENLSDPRIIRRMKVDIKSLRRNDRLFVINYLEVWAEILEDKIVIKSQKNALNDQLQSTNIYGEQESETDKELNGLTNKPTPSTT